MIRVIHNFKITLAFIIIFLLKGKSKFNAIVLFFQCLPESRILKTKYWCECTLQEIKEYGFYDHCKLLDT